MPTIAVALGRSAVPPLRLKTNKTSSPTLHFFLPPFFLSCFLLPMISGQSAIACPAHSRHYLHCGINHHLGGLCASIFPPPSRHKAIVLLALGRLCPGEPLISPLPSRRSCPWLRRTSFTQLDARQGVFATFSPPAVRPVTG